LKSGRHDGVLSFDLPDQKISNLGDPDSQSTALVTLPYKIGCTLATTRTELFLGTDVGDLLAFDTAQQLGVKQDVGSEKSGEFLGLTNSLLEALLGMAGVAFRW
jgi:hypothetical protein